MKRSLSGSSLQRLLLFLSLSCLPALGLAQGTVVAWGLGDRGQTDEISMRALSGVIDVEAGESHVLALKRDGTLRAWGDNRLGQLFVSSYLDIVAISAGDNHNLALRSNGTVVAWGNNNYGQINIPAGLTDVVAVSGGGVHSLLLKSDGTVVVVGGAWGCKTDQIPAGLDNVVAIAAGFCHNLALTADGKVHAWGANVHGEATVPAGLEDVVAIDAGHTFSLALKADGTVVVFGNRDDPWSVGDAPADLTDAVAIAAGANHALALRANGTVVAWECGACPDLGATAVPAGLSNVTHISAGHAFGVAVIGVPPEPVPVTHTYLGTVTRGEGSQAGLLPVGTQVIVSVTANLTEFDWEDDTWFGAYLEGLLSLNIEAPAVGLSVTTGTGSIGVSNDHEIFEESGRVWYSDGVSYSAYTDGTGMLGDFPVEDADFSVFQTLLETIPTLVVSDDIPAAPLKAGSASIRLGVNITNYGFEFNTWELDIHWGPTVAEAVEDAAARIRELVASDQLKAGVGKSLLKRLDLVLGSAQAQSDSTCRMFAGLSKRVAHLPRRNAADQEVGAELDALLLVLGSALGGCG